MISAGAMAQAQTVSTAPSTPPPTTQVQEIIVTGSRIPRPNLDQPTPVSTLSSQQLDDSGTADLGQALANLPSIGTFSGNRANSDNFGNGAGVSEIDLRNLGTSRTLVLVDGQRHVDGDIGTDAVDVNSIPSSLVDHVEVITGGASAIYGSDAVSGVVNIILKHDFEGVELQGQAGDYEAAFGAQYSAHATLGHNFDFLGGRMNITFAGFYNHENGIEASDLPYSHNYGLITNSADIPAGTFDPTYFSSGAAITGDHIPDNLLVPNVGTELLARNGVLLDPNTFLPITGFTAAGAPVTQPARTGFNSFTFGQLPGTCISCYFEDSTNQVLSPNEQRGLRSLPTMM